VWMMKPSQWNQRGEWRRREGRLSAGNVRRKAISGGIVPRGPSRLTRKMRLTRNMKGEAAGAAESDSESKGAWCMEENLDSVNFEGAVQGAKTILQISIAEDKVTASSNGAMEGGDWFLDAIK